MGLYIKSIVNGEEIRTFVKKGIPYIRVSDMDKFFVNMSNMEKIPKKSKIKNNIKLQDDDLLISRSGTLGLISIITPEIRNAIISSHIIRIEIENTKELNPYYLCTFLNSKYGYLQILQKSYGGVVPEISQDGLKELMIYIPQQKQFQVYIENLVKKAYEKNKIAKQKYNQAENLLYNLLNIKKEIIKNLETEKTYETNFKEVWNAHRIDAEFFHMKFLGILDLLNYCPFNLIKLKNHVKISPERINPKESPYKKKSFKYVSIAKISEDGEIYKWDEFYGWKAPSRARVLIKKNDILIPSLTGTFNKIALIPEDLDNQLATTGCFNVKAKKDNPEFLFLLFRNPIFKSQLEQQTTGAIMSAVTKKKFSNLIIPEVPLEMQKEITKLIKEYFKLKKESRQIIQSIIKEVEEMVENASKSNINGKQ